MIHDTERARPSVSSPAGHLNLEGTGLEDATVQSNDAISPQTTQVEQAVSTNALKGARQRLSNLGSI
jgi:hypothetical protein